MLFLILLEVSPYSSIEVGRLGLDSVMTILRPLMAPTFDSTESTGGLVIDLEEKRLLMD